MSSMGKRPVKLGLILTPIEDRGGTATPSWSDLATLARTAEDVGFDSIWISDHLLHRFPEVPDYGIWECWSLISALAAITKRMQVGQWVLCSGFRNPALVAKMVETVDEISDGRVIVGIGSGWHKPEYDAFGFPFDNRVARFEEAITIIHGLLRTGQIDFDGTYYQARNCELRPRGPRPNGAPIMIGTIGGTPLAERLGVKGTSPRMLELSAQFAEMWNCPWVNDPSLIPSIQTMVDEACVKVGRDPKTLQRSHGLMLNVPGWESHPGIDPIRKGRAAMGAVTAGPEEHAELIRQFAAAGIDELHIQLDPETPAAIETFGRTIELLDRG
jgi:alkanesulfonate monooxygenase SsuD/methylene tetrahydromethanopterin reductase-like flavin-dependent oxidoreductase (luciferase family)